MEQGNGHIATFYSYKGGTGRSMALANFAWIMAASGNRVLAIDWDLEAPGLHRYFRPFLVDPDLFETDGLIDMFWTFAASAVTRTKATINRSIDDSEYISEALDDSTRRLDWKFSAGGYIDFVGAGRQGGTYSERVNTFDWRHFYELGGAEVLNTFKEHVRNRYDWILIDSRTGVSDTSGICTIQMPDILVACFTLNRQGIEGVSAILGSVRAYRSSSVDGSEIEFFPVAMRIENAEQERLEVARKYARTLLEDFLPKAMQMHPRDYWDDMELAYRPWYAFEEILAAFGDATGALGSSDTMLAQVEAMARRIAKDDDLYMPQVVPLDRTRVLAEYAFAGTNFPVTSWPSRRWSESGLTVRSAPPVSDVAGDPLDLNFQRGVLAKEQLWRASGFSWRHLLSRREIDLLTDGDRRDFSRNMAYYFANSQRAQSFFRGLDFAFLFNCTISATTLWISFDSLRASSPVIELLPLLMGLTFITMWLALTFLWAVIAIWLINPPHGIRLFEVASILVMRPIRGYIRDYQISPKKSA